MSDTNKTPSKVDTTETNSFKTVTEASTTSPAARASLSGAGTPADSTDTKSMQSQASSGSTGGGSATAMGADAKAEATKAESAGVKPIGAAALADERKGDRADSDKAAADMASASHAGGDKSAKEMAQETAEAAKSRAKEVADRAKAEAAQMGEKAKSMAYDKADAYKAQGAGEIDRTAERVRAAGQEFGEGSYPAQAADYVASSLSQAADAIRNQDIDGVVGEVSRFARRNPAVFLGGAALLGFAVARMMKASERARMSEGGYDPYGRRMAPPPAGIEHTPHAAKRAQGAYNTGGHH